MKRGDLIDRYNAPLQLPRTIFFLLIFDMNVVWACYIILVLLRSSSDTLADFFRAVARISAHPTHRCVPGLRLDTAPKPIIESSYDSHLFMIPPTPFPMSRLHPHCSHFSLFPSTVPHYAIDSDTSPPNGRVILLVHEPLYHCPYARRTYNSKPACSTHSPCLGSFPLDDMSYLTYRCGYIAWSLYYNKLYFK
ncbi:hypothetical protein BGY98DRAFT_371228 [Russula aff. rugulosa BPL654]|nr:hypothetical protein BGY98DRAFT_371228 [Russula aff. rugulosa BPL654]